MNPEQSKRRCTGFGERRDICENDAGTPWTPLWCAECDEERRATITRQMAAITTSEGADRA